MPWFVLLGLGICLGLGIWFRGANLGQVYWHDEAYTSLRLSGFTAQALNQALFQGNIITAADLLKFQWPQPENNIDRVIQALAIDDAQHPPLYYILVWYWLKLWGASIPAIRSFSVVVSLLGFPALYWWCQELWAQPRSVSRVSSPLFSPELVMDPKLVGGLAVVLLALSPFHILYAQEAREYALWTVLVLVINASFYQALHRQNRWCWFLYGLGLTLGLYTFPLTGLVALAHGLFLLISARQNLRPWGVATGLSFLSFSPWLYLILSTWQQTGATWTASPIPLAALWQAWGLNLIRCFYFTDGTFGLGGLGMWLLLGFLLVVVAGSSYIFCRTTPRRVWLGVVLLILTTTLPFALTDLIAGGQRSTSSRYLIPAILAMQIMLAYGLTWLCSHVRVWQRWVGWLVLSVLLSLGLAGGVAIGQAETTWIKFLSYSFPELYRPLQTTPNALIMGTSGNINTGTILALSHGLSPETPLILLDHRHPEISPTPPLIPPTVEIVWGLNLAEPIRATLETQQRMTSELVFEDEFLQLWQFKPRPR